MSIDPTRAQTVFLEAVEIADSQERAAYLKDACADDALLRLRVDALLHAYQQPDSLLDAPMVSSRDSASGTDAPEWHPDNVATRRRDEPGSDDADEAFAFLSPPRRPESLGRLGHYEMLELLGRGGFGIVFRAFDEVLQRVVAVKVLAPRLAVTSPARKRFLREARSSAKVRHENLVQVFSVEEEPLPYLVMEFIPGETLQQRMDRSGPLEIPEVIRIGRQIAEGLAAAHAAGLIHRDIKPANVMIESGPQERVRITDFGLARAADDASLSHSGVVAGTPMFMAPEQARGEVPDPRADLFSLGSVMYTMITGRPPFRASNALAVLKRVTEDVPRPIPQLIPEAPEWLCRIVAKLHAKNPEMRYQSAREIAEALADCELQLTRHGQLRDFTHIPGGSPKRRRRHWIWFAAAMAILAFLPFVAAVIAMSFNASLERRVVPAEVPSPMAQQPAPPERPAANTENPELVKALTQLVEAKRRNVNVLDKRVTAGQASQTEIVAAQIELTEAEIRLAEARNDRAALITQLQALVAQRQSERALVEKLVKSNAAPIVMLNNVDAQVADAKARLAKVKGQSAPP